MGSSSLDPYTDSHSVATPIFNIISTDAFEFMLLQRLKNVGSACYAQATSYSKVGALHQVDIE